MFVHVGLVAQYALVLHVTFSVHTFDAHSHVHGQVQVTVFAVQLIHNCACVLGFVARFVLLAVQHAQAIQVLQFWVGSGFAQGIVHCSVVGLVSVHSSSDTV